MHTTIVGPFPTQEYLHVIWYPRSMHSDLCVGDRLYNFGPNGDLYHGKRTLSGLSSSYVKFSVPLKIGYTQERVLQELENKTLKPSFWNTCMGSVAEVINATCRVKIPRGIGQSPECAAIYLALKYKFFPQEGIKFSVNNISNKALCWHSMTSLMVQSVAVAAWVHWQYECISRLNTWF